MEPARSIGKLGFRRWYERQLYESFAWFVTCILCAVLIGVSIEGVSVTRSSVTLLLMLVFVYLAGMLCWRAGRRFIEQLLYAQHLASHSTCARCGTYGRYEVVREVARMPVRCRVCGNEWVVE